MPPFVRHPMLGHLREIRQLIQRSRWCVLLLGMLASARAQGPASLEMGWSSRGPLLKSTDDPGAVLILQQSATLGDWHEVARVFDRLAPYHDPVPDGASAAFYRLERHLASINDDWSNQLPATTQRLFRPGTGSGLAGIAIVKWSVLLDRPGHVFFQDTVKYPFHLNFARARLPGYETISAFAYGQQCLYPGPNQRMVVGSVMRAPVPWIRELGIEITGSTTFPAVQAVDWMEAVQRRLALESGWKVFYMPSEEQETETEAHRDLFEARGIAVDSPNRWASSTRP
ncbi:MAG: hypothetical protein JNK85_27865 [Verrucomicrobiales bacterium]|nr:hypothetical protein [Verrucomicrobiales bacterium]